MARARSPNRDKAMKMWLESNGSMKLKEIAAELSLGETQIRKWKNQDDWGSALKGNVTNEDPKGNVTKRRGPPKGSKNALGNKGGSAPEGNKNAEKHGFFSKYMPAETLEIMKEIEARQPIDLLWDQIAIQYTAIIRAQQIMYVKDQKDKTTTKIEEKFGNVSGERWEVQHAWDKQAAFLQAQSRAMGELRSLIKQYEEMCRQDEVDEEKKLRIAKLKLEVKDLSGDGDGDAHKQNSGYAEALNVQATDVFADEVEHGEET